jgi:hypothetical protein
LTERRKQLAVAIGMCATVIAVCVLVGMAMIPVLTPPLERAFGPFGDFSLFYVGAMIYVVVLVFASVALGFVVFDRLRPPALEKSPRCPTCGYDLRGHVSSGSPHPDPLPEGEGTVVCPECGANSPGGAAGM